MRNARLSLQHFAAALTCLVVLFSAAAAAAMAVPALKGRVNDYAGLLSAATAAQLEAALQRFEQTESTQLVVLTVPSLEGDSLEDFSIRVAEKWRIGREGLDNGAILLVARKERKLRIEVGYGLEGTLTDLMAGRIIRNVIVPHFKSGRFDDGILAGVNAMMATVRGEFKESVQRGAAPRSSRGAGDWSMPLFFLLLATFWFGRISRGLSMALGGILAPLIGFLFFSPGLLILLALAIGGIVAGLLLSLTGSALPAASRGSVRRSPGGFFYHSGGGFGGGFGGGGFSGGGGGFGGGGASGSW